MKNEVLLILFILVLVNPSVFSFLNKRSKRLTKKSYSYTLNQRAVNYCGASQPQNRPQPGGNQQNQGRNRGQFNNQQYRPQPHNPQPYSPQPNRPQPYSPQPNRPQPYSPQPNRPQPYSPQPYRPQPYSPQPYSPQPNRHQPINPQPYRPQPYRPQPQPQYNPYDPNSRSRYQHMKKELNGERFTPPNNKILLKYKKNIIYPDDNQEPQKEKEASNNKNNSKSAHKKRKYSEQYNNKYPNRNQYQPQPGFNRQQQHNFQPTFNGQRGQPQQFGDQKFYNPKQPGEDPLNPNKFINAPGNIPENLERNNYISLNQSGINKLLQVITPQRWKKDHSKEKKECFGELPIYNQGQCGSCFIFSAVSFFSIFHCFSTNKFVSYSQQDMVSCQPPATHLGVPNNCKGGLPKFTWDYMFKNGILEQSCQCYESHDKSIRQCNRNSCKDNSRPNITKPEHKEVIHMRNINMVAYAIEYIGPLMAGISINSENVNALNYFNQGIQGKVKYDLKTLFGGVVASGQHAGHAIVIVGYRVR